MFILLSWLFFGLMVGSISKFIHPGKDPIGWIPTLLVGVAGSYLGGFLYCLIWFDADAYHPAGLLFSIFGGIIALSLWRAYLKNAK
jgi:uncharacterized membrane protein YeaQ/YmgE (transglycosylase-associated protein family)